MRHPASLSAMLALAAGAAMVPASAVHAAIVYSATLDSVTRSEFSGILFSTAQASARPALVGDFGSDKQFELRLSAPVGKKFRLAGLPAGAQSHVLYAVFMTTPTLSIAGTGPGGAIDFSGASGEQPDMSYSIIDIGAGPNQLRTESNGLVSSTLAFEFETLTMRFDVPNAFNTVFGASFVPEVLYLQAAAFYPSSTVPGSAPDQLLTLVPIPTTPVPEPGSLLLTTLALGLLAARPRRRSAPA